MTDQEYCITKDAQKTRRSCSEKKLRKAFRRRGGSYKPGRVVYNERRMRQHETQKCGSIENRNAAIQKADGGEENEQRIHCGSRPDRRCAAVYCLQKGHRVERAARGPGSTADVGRAEGEQPGGHLVRTE